MMKMWKILEIQIQDTDTGLNYENVENIGDTDTEAMATPTGESSK